MYSRSMIKRLVELPCNVEGGESVRRLTAVKLRRHRQGDFDVSNFLTRLAVFNDNRINRSESLGVGDRDPASSVGAPPVR